VQRAAKEKPATPPMAAPFVAASETTRRSRSSTIRKQRDDLNVDAVFAKLKTIGARRRTRE